MHPGRGHGVDLGSEICGMRSLTLMADLGSLVCDLRSEIRNGMIDTRLGPDMDVSNATVTLSKHSNDGKIYPKLSKPICKPSPVYMLRYVPTGSHTLPHVPIHCVIVPDGSPTYYNSLRSHSNHVNIANK